MNTARSAKLIFGTALMIVALVALQACTTSGSAKNTNSSYVGMGDLHRFEAQASVPDSAVDPRTAQLARLDELAKIKDDAFVVEASDPSYAGMGDLHCFEATQEIQYAGESNSPSP
jgi:hypothetical protein